MQFDYQRRGKASSGEPGVKKSASPLPKDHVVKKTNRTEIKKTASQPVSSDSENDDDDYSDDEDNDAHSTGSSRDNEAEDQQQQEDPHALQDWFDGILENLNDKRGPTREEALGELRKLMAARYLASLLEGKLETLLELLKKGTRRGTPIENRLSSEAISLCFLLLGPDNESVFNDYSRLFEDSVRNGQELSSKPAAIQALGIGCFILSTEVDTTASTMDFFEEVFSRNYPDEIAAPAVKAWSLLATTIPPTRIPALIQKNIKQLKKHLTAELGDLRNASGLAIALLFEISRGEEQEDPITDESYEELMESLNLLSKDADRHKGKKERSKQRSIFRDILRTMEGGSFPEQTLKFKQEQVELTSWSNFHQLESIRELLGEGFHVHFQRNDTIREIFGLPPSDTAEEHHTKLTSIEKRMYYSPNSPAAKARSKWLDTRRSTKQSSREAVWN